MSRRSSYPCGDFEHFRHIARSYWQHAVYPNHVLPALAPHCPLIHVSKTGHIQLHDATQYMLALTRTQGFAPSEALLREAAMPAAVFEQVCRSLQGAGHWLPSSPEHGRTLALQQCRQQQKRPDAHIEGRHHRNCAIARLGVPVRCKRRNAQSSQAPLCRRSRCKNRFNTHPSRCNAHQHRCNAHQCRCNGHRLNGESLCWCGFQEALQNALRII